MKTIMTFILTFAYISSAYAAGVNVDYEIGSQTYEGYYTSSNKDAPLILLIHDWDGLTDYEVKRAEMLAELGYSVFAADLFGKGVRPTEVVDKRQHTGALYKDREKLRALMQGALDAASKQGGNIDNAVSMGYCFGGAAVLEQARAGVNLQGFVTFHGGLSTPEGQDYSKTQGPMLIFHGSADSSITLQDFAALASELEQQDVSHEMITYGGAPHAFTVFDTPAYRADVDSRSWQRFLEFLKSTL